MGLKVNFAFFRGNSILLLFLLLSTDFALDNEKDSLYFEEFQKFMIKYNKNYQSEEELKKRFGYFKESLNFIEENKDKVKHKIGINKYSDISQEEWNRMFPPLDLSGLEPLNEKGKLFLSKLEQKTISIPETLDFREQGKVTHVKNQGPCNSCPLFAIIATIEAQYKNKKGVLESFSEQQLYDCMDYHTKCENLIVVTRVFQYYGNLKYLYKEDFYKYKLRDDKKNCKSFEQAKASGKNEAIRLNSVDFLGLSNEDNSIPIDMMKQLLYEINGPIFVTIDSQLIKGYVGDIIKTNPCSKGSIPDHAVVIVGYGVDKDGSTYWIVKNSYGKDWGESGYFRVLAGENLCSIENLALFPDVRTLDFYDWCPMEGCIECSSSGGCTKCGKGYYLEDNTCKKCIDNCLDCENNKDCKKCDIWGGYYMAENLCHKCQSDFEICEEAELCKDNYYVDSNKKCVKSSIKNCQYVVMNNNIEVCQMCDDGYGLNQKKECQKCSISNCRTCQFDDDGDEICLKCEYGYSEPILSNPPTNSCSKCKDGCNYCLNSESSYRDENGNCFDCPQKCEKCELIFNKKFDVICIERGSSDDNKAGSIEVFKTSIVFFLISLLF